MAHAWGAKAPCARPAGPARAHLALIPAACPGPVCRGRPWPVPVSPAQGLPCDRRPYPPRPVPEARSCVCQVSLEEQQGVVLIVIIQRPGDGAAVTPNAPGHLQRCARRSQATVAVPVSLTGPLITQRSPAWAVGSEGPGSR